MCDDDELAVIWSAFDPNQDWSDGWQMVIDRDNRGAFPPGTIVSANGGPAVSLEQVSAGRQTLTVDVHWERIGTGTGDKEFGTFSVSVTASPGCDN